MLADADLSWNPRSILDEVKTKMYWKIQLERKQRTRHETRLKKRPHFYVYSSSCAPVTYLMWSWVGRWGTLRWRIGRRFRVVLLSFFCLLRLEIIEDVGFGVVSIQSISELQDIEVVTEVTQKIVLVHTDVAKVAFDEITGACCRISLRNIICREIFPPPDPTVTWLTLSTVLGGGCLCWSNI